MKYSLEALEVAEYLRNLLGDPPEEEDKDWESPEKSARLPFLVEDFAHDTICKIPVWNIEHPLGISQVRLPLVKESLEVLSQEYFLPSKGLVAKGISEFLPFKPVGNRFKRVQLTFMDFIPLAKTLIFLTSSQGSNNLIPKWGLMLLSLEDILAGKSTDRFNIKSLPRKIKLLLLRDALPSLGEFNAFLEVFPYPERVYNNFVSMRYSDSLPQILEQIEYESRT